MKFFILLFAVISLQETVFAEVRVWRMKDGSAVAGEYIQSRLGNVYLRDPNNETRSISIKEDDLCAADQRYIQAKMPPKITIQLRAQEKPEKGRYADPDTSYVNAIVTVKKRSKEPVSGKLTAEVYLVREEVSVDLYRILAKKEVDILFPEDGNSSEFETELSAKLYEVAPGYDRIMGWRYAGYLVVVFGFDGEMLQYKTDLNWLDEEAIDTFRKMPIYQFFDKDLKSRRTPRPETFLGN